MNENNRSKVQRAGDVPSKERLRLLAVRIEESGIAIGWADDATLHACLGVAHAPIAQGKDAAASGVALRAWFSGLVTRANAAAPVMIAPGVQSKECFHRLGGIEFAMIEDALGGGLYSWTASLDAAGLSAGRFYAIAGTEDGRLVATQIRFTPFL